MKTVLLLIGLVVASIHFAETQQLKRVPRIGFLEGASISESQGIEPFRQGLRELGYIDGQNIVVDIRAMEGKTHRIPDLIDELNRSKVDMIVTPVGMAFDRKGRLLVDFVGPLKREMIKRKMRRAREDEEGDEGAEEASSAR